MPLTAATAYQMSQNAGSVNATNNVNTEIGLVEARILNAATYDLYSIVYSAVLIGNPAGDPNVDASLTENQTTFRDSLRDSGYQIGQDSATGFWSISWVAEGPEAQISVYEIHSSVVPGGITAQTIVALDAYFAALSPVATDRVLLGGTAISGTYVHIVMAHQQTTADLSSGVLAALTSTGLGYTGGNTSVTKKG